MAPRISALAAAALPAVALGTVCKYPGGECYELNMDTCQGSDAPTIHGLWPQWAESCGKEFDESAVSSIEGELHKYWKSCPEYGGDDVGFWKHEWEKHGSCTGMDELTFFNTTLTLFQQYKGQCTGGCKICLAKDLKTLETCQDETPAVNANKPASTIVV
eukprot:TRINITY_DN36536_c0_g1_i1.p1 TRINITY_DN36536_c0_g1~~TRINITY_DN36536_c0_g1_i1.p1  ORF type:complete len:160 (+),score=50.59 TRINITY_DN36536_c0_g1_i1:101-580(+)